MKYTSIRITILVNFLLLILVTASALIGIQYYFSERLVVSAAKDKLSEISDTIQLQSNQLAKDSAALLNLLEEYGALAEPVMHSHLHPAMDILIKGLKQYPNAYAVYIGHQNGDFYEVINLKNDPVLYQKLSAPKEARWAIITLSQADQHQSKQFHFVDERLQPISGRIENTSYSPAVRPWFQNAMKSKDVFQTEPYLFVHLNAPGLTFSKRVQNTNSVIAIDFTTAHLTKGLIAEKPTPDSKIFVFNEDGQILFNSEPLAGETIKAIDVKPVSLSEKEQAYVDKGESVSVSNQLNWAPFDFQERGKALGYSVDLLQLIAAKTGLIFNFVNDYKWFEVMNAFEQGSLDVVHSLSKTEERERLGMFTEPFYRMDNYFISRDRTPLINSFTEFNEHPLALVKGWSMNPYIQKHYPDIRVRFYSSIIEALKAVANGEAKATIDTDKTFTYLRRKYALTNLKLNRVLPESLPIREASLYMMVSKQRPELLSILNKGIDAVSVSEQQHLEQKWGLVKGTQDNDLALKNRVPDSIMALFHKGEAGQVIKLKVQGKTYLSAYQPLFNYNHSSSLLAVMIPRDTLMGPYAQIMIYSILMALLVLALIIPLTYWNTGQLVQPIIQLMRMNGFIQQQRYAEVKPVKTYIAELHDLSDSLINMSDSIQNYEKSQAELLDAIIKLVAEAIDAKSPYTGAHCKRVPELARMILDAANQDERWAFKAFSLTDKEELRAFEIGAWLHDCGKVTTPEYVVDKATKLETVYNRIHEIRTRFEVLWRDAEIAYYQALLSKQDPHQAKQSLDKTHQRLKDEFAFIASVNIGGEFMDQALQDRVKEIARQTWTRHFDDRLGLSIIELERYSDEPETLPVTECLLDDKTSHLVKRDNFDFDEYQRYGFKTPVPEYLYNLGEVYNLCISKGTLSHEERYKIQEHVMMTIKMLTKIPFPDIYANIPEYAGTHHETMDGMGYPRGLTREALSIPARIMVVADVFEALTASDRPYKESKTLSESLQILKNMRDDQHIDAQVFEIFLRSGVYLDYAKRYLKPEQIDDVNIDDYLSF